ncbi:MAG: hypothetical protein MUD13_06565 [Candidatus Nanopelagicales bacterium]|jgi:hypothetical protein|nr:hypothetical protein [Candidatus Nanopelagicales bacterium]
MSTKTDETKVTAQAISVAAMPPLEVTREGIPEHEHVPVEPTSTRREHRARDIAAALVGVLAVLLVVAGTLIAVRFTTEMGHMGLTAEAWQEYRAGERAAFLEPTAGHMGLTPQAWQEYRMGERGDFVAMAGGYLGLEAAGVHHS